MRNIIVVHNKDLSYVRILLDQSTRMGVAFLTELDICPTRILWKPSPLTLQVVMREFIFSVLGRKKAAHIFKLKRYVTSTAISFVFSFSQFQGTTSPGLSIENV